MKTIIFVNTNQEMFYDYLLANQINDNVCLYVYAYDLFQVTVSIRLEKF